MSDVYWYNAESGFRRGNDTDRNRRGYNSNRTEPLPQTVVPGNHNFVVHFYTADDDGSNRRVLENYTTIKTYSARANSRSDALKAAEGFAERKMSQKSFLIGYRVELVSTEVLVDTCAD